MIKIFRTRSAEMERRTVGILLAVGLAVLVGKGALESKNKPHTSSSSTYVTAETKAVPVSAPVSRAVEATKADDSKFNYDLSNAHSSRNLSKADLAWHALNTYGWNCSEVIAEKQSPAEKYSVITCSSGLKLRVYRRSDAHPIIRNMKGGYE
ncbi:hypothetical protein [Pseudomonas lurida]|jgi:hypothetical protein|uniref:hypothetical protein n=1 Tax=Pseudomonas lurida TaxID=244566 RepID=UPI0034D97ED2